MIPFQEGGAEGGGGVRKQKCVVMVLSERYDYKYIYRVGRISCRVMMLKITEYYERQLHCPSLQKPIKLDDIS